MALPTCTNSKSAKRTVLPLNGGKQRLAELDRNLMDQAFTHVWLVKPE
jgi:hypothetical protein